MAREKLGLAIFAGLVGTTGLISSGALVDVNPWLKQWNQAAIERNSDAPSDLVQTNDDTAVSETGGDAKPEEKIVEANQLESTGEPVTAENSEPSAAVETEAVAEKPASEDVVDEKTDADDTDLEASVAQQPLNQEQLNQPPAIDDPSPATAEIAMPTFDILRVEPDGSTLIAGVAEPMSEVELVAGSNTLTKTTANNRGEFVAVLDEPLANGDHQIVLRATSPDGAVMTSAETAIVSIPETGSSNEVLALVEAPGAPSRLITLPNTTPALVPVEPQAPTAVTQNDETLEVAEEVAQAEPQVPAPTKVTPEKTAIDDLRIEAVEIDGPTVFVAGSAQVGARIRIYANDILLGDSIANAEGRFLVDVNRDLPVGDYLIRADSLGSDGVDVLMRVAVPFTRSEGEKLAAVAVPVAPLLPNEPPKFETAEPPVEAPEIAVPKIDAPGADDILKLRKETDTASAASPTTDVVQPAEPSVDLAERLAPAGQSVIIRRGDTLWQISRRVYGQGVKFTTIYAANEDQIKDPDRIWPGQVFTLPEETSDNDS